MKRTNIFLKLHEAGFAQTAAAITNADLLLANQFVFTHPYDMEPYHKVVAMAPIDWLYTPNSDEEWVFMLNRQEYLLDLLVAYRLTDVSQYLLKGKELVLDWISQCQDPTTNAWRTIDTGIRLTYWSLLLKELQQEELLSAAETTLIKDSVATQVTHLTENYLSKYDLSNWGVLISGGVIIAANLHSGWVSKEDYEINLARLTQQVQLQIQNSGLHWEQSPLYFMEVWRTLTAVWLSYAESERSCPVFILTAIDQMLQVAPYLVKPDGYLIQQGDTDRINIDDMVQTVSLLRVSPLTELNSQVINLDLLLVSFDAGANDLVDTDIAARIKSLTTAEKETHYQDFETGNFFFRDSWHKTGSYLHVSSGPIGSGHGHAALGHLDYASKGEDILIDPGRYTYQEIAERMTLKAASAHNVLVLNQQPFTEIKDSWAFSKSATPLASLSKATEAATVTQISYLDQQAQGDVLVTRTIIWLADHELLIIGNYCQGEGTHDLEQYLNFAPTVSVTPEGGGFSLATASQKLYLQTSLEHQQIQAGWFSPTYNKKEATTKLKSGTTFVDHHFSYTVLSAQAQTEVTFAEVKQSGTDATVAQEKCVAITIKSEGEEHLLAWQHQDTFAGHKLYYVANQGIYGKVVWLNNRKKEYRRLL